MFCYFVSDLHGSINKYKKLFDSIIKDKPELIFIGGDILPRNDQVNFLQDFILPNLNELKKKLKENYPIILLILGNNDSKQIEKNIIEISEQSFLKYIHFKYIEINDYKIFGYSYTPPSPFLLKDWEKYDIGFEIEKGCISPENGIRTAELNDNEKKYKTIIDDLKLISNDKDLTKSIFLFHGPPYRTNLDIVSYDYKNKTFVHVGSKAIRKFIEQKQPYLTLHGHIHESTRISGSWIEKIGNTTCISASHDGSELCLIKFELENLLSATRVLI
ncbi:MAG: metallophosphoesterase [Melioribacter sp.]|nr:metallophosphoesterase [Melioribacter sp.]